MPVSSTYSKAISATQWIQPSRWHLAKLASATYILHTNPRLALSCVRPPPLPHAGCELSLQMRGRYHSVEQLPAEMRKVYLSCGTWEARRPSAPSASSTVLSQNIVHMPLGAEKPRGTLEDVPFFRSMIVRISYIIFLYIATDELSDSAAVCPAARLSPRRAGVRGASPRRERARESRERRVHPGGATLRESDGPGTNQDVKERTSA